MSEKFVTVKEFEEYKKFIQSNMGNTKKVKSTRPPTEYNIFVGEHIGIIKKDNPKFTQVDAMKKCAELWNEHKEKKLSKSSKSSS